MSTSTNTLLRKAGSISLFMAAIVLGMKQLREPDLFWIIRSGQWIWEQMSIPFTDPFSYTFHGEEWVNIKWMFELLAYFISANTGPEFVFFLQVIANIVIVVLVLKLAQEIIKLFGKKVTDQSSMIFVLFAFAYLTGTEFRMIGRPEMISHMLVAAYLLLFLRYRKTQDKHIYLLIPLQVLWSNMHDGYVSGIALLIIYTLGSWTDLYLQSIRKEAVLKLTAVAAISILATVLNPRGGYLLVHPIEVYEMIGANTFTTELNSAFKNPSYYFSQYQTIVLILLVVLTAFALIIEIKKRRLKMVISNLGMGFILAVFALLYLSLTWHRSIVFGFIAIVPLLSALVAAQASGKESLSKFLPLVNVVIGLTLFFSVVTNGYYSITQSPDRYGLEVYQEKNPIGAAKFIAENNLNHQRAFSDYLTSSYFLWSLSPDFQSFIDLRDLDVFTPDFFQEFNRITQIPDEFEQADQKYGFNHVMLNSPNFPVLHRYLNYHPDWSLVYADPIAAIYLKHNSQNEELIAKYSLQENDTLGYFYDPAEIPPSSVSRILNYIFWPFYNSRRPKSSLAETTRFYQQIYDFDRAERWAFKMLNNPQTRYDGYRNLGQMYLTIGGIKKAKEDQLRYAQMASDAFYNGYTLDKERTECLIGLASTSLFTSQYDQALKYFEKAREKDRSNANIERGMGTCYQNLINQNKSLYTKYYPLMIEHFERALYLNPNDIQIHFSLILMYCDNGECDEARRLLGNFNENSLRTRSQRAQLTSCKKKCG
ncbi:MAG TPA: hypothetical protein DDX92_01355 [Flavobacteriales bacterium]|jgi:tetratricopeptide (TPR) repeat protein|nr:hypothetical protein [Flavobacteriales bacterium]